MRRGNHIHKAIINDVHQRGATVWTRRSVVWFWKSLQNAFDLVDDVNGNREAQISSRLALVLDDLDFDVLEMSFGEFFDEEPQEFIDSVNQAYDAVVSPGIEMTSRLHVGDDLQVTYDDEEMIYYFLGCVRQSRDNSMGAYRDVLQSFSSPVMGLITMKILQNIENFLFDRLENGLPVAYFPESAYWVAFDNLGTDVSSDVCTIEMVGYVGN